MPILKPFTVPASAKALELPQDSKAKLFIAFISSADPVTKQPWCPDVRQTLPYINAAFTPSEAPELAIIEVGQRAEYVYSLYIVSWIFPARHRVYITILCLRFFFLCPTTSFSFIDHATSRISQEHPSHLSI